MNVVYLEYEKNGVTVFVGINVSQERLEVSLISLCPTVMMGSHLDLFAIVERKVIIVTVGLTGYVCYLQNCSNTRFFALLFKLFVINCSVVFVKYSCQWPFKR